MRAGVSGQGILVGVLSLLDPLRRRATIPSREFLLYALRATAAATFAYGVGLWLSSNPKPVLAPLTALLVVQVSVYSTLTSGLRRIGSVTAGVLIAVALSEVVGLAWWSLALVVLISLVIGQVLRLQAELIEVPISAMLVLAVGGAEYAARGRVAETLIGAVTGTAVNVLLASQVRVGSAGTAVEGLGQRLAELLDTMGDRVASGVHPEDARTWLAEARALDHQVATVDRALVEAEDSIKLNPRGRRAQHSGPTLRTGLDALEYSTVAVRGIARAISDRAVEVGEGASYEPQERVVLADLLHRLARVSVDFAEVVRAESFTRSGFAEERLAETLAAARAAHERLAKILVDQLPRDLSGWEDDGALLANVERVLAELDLDARARARQQWRAAGTQPTPAEAMVRRVSDRVSDSAAPVAGIAGVVRRRAHEAVGQVRDHVGRPVHGAPGAGVGEPELDDGDVSPRHGRETEQRPGD